MEVFRFDPVEWMPLLHYYAAVVGHSPPQGTDSARLQHPAVLVQPARHCGDVCKVHRY